MESEASHLPRGCMLPSATDANASRNMYRALQRLGLMWKVPTTEFQHRCDDCKVYLSIPYIKPSDFLAYLLEHASELLFGGEVEPTKQSDCLRAFWTHYKDSHPRCRIFEEFPNHLHQFLPLFLHGDEGRGLRKGQTSILSFEVPFGLGGSKQRHLPMCGCAECLSYDVAVRLGLDAYMDHYTINGASFQETNMKHHSFITRFLMWSIHSRQFKACDRLIPDLLKEIARNLRGLFFEGLAVKGKQYHVCCIGMKGDLKWLVRSVCQLQRSYFNLAEVHDQEMCHECGAGTVDRPFEDVSMDPCWEDSIYTQRPWIDEYEPPLGSVPFDSHEPERFLKRDLFHTLKTGVYRDWTASCLLLVLDLWQYFTDRDSSEGNALGVKLKRAHGSFALFCQTCRKPPALHSFSQTLLNRKTKDSYPWFNVKGSDVMLIMEWLVAILGGFIQAPLDQAHTPLLRMMRRGSEIAVEFFQVLYQHGLWLDRACAARVYALGYEFQQTYARLAGVALRELKFAGWAMKPKMHSFSHTLVEIKTLLRQGAIKIANPLIHSCEQNEDLVGKISRTSRRCHQKLLSKRVLQLYLVKARALHRRYRAKAQASQKPLRHPAK